MDKPTEAEKQELWEWCGFEQREFDRVKFSMGNGDIYRIDWVHDSGYQEHALPTTDLNNLFLFAVPKLQELNLKLELAFTAYDDCSNYVRGEGFKKKYTWLVDIFNTDYSKCLVREMNDKDPALALFRAIWKVKAE